MELKENEFDSLMGESAISLYRSNGLYRCGCIGCGGQTIPTNAEIRKKRIDAIYAEDEGKAIRKSNKNPEFKQIYKDFLKELLYHKSHELLHTKYRKRNRY